MENKQTVLSFVDALTSNGKSVELPEEFNYFGKLIGSWNFDYIDHNMSCSTKGEWHFSWVLEGMAVQDVIILPSRDIKMKPLILSLSTEQHFVSTIRIHMLGILPTVIQGKLCDLKQGSRMI